MKEIEVKILNIDVKDIEQKLNNLGADLIFSDTLEALYFNLPEYLPNGTSITIRLRKEGSNNVLTMKTAKEQLNNIKIREETEVEFDNFKNMHKILKTIGLSERLHIKKYRKIYHLKSDDVKFMIDIHLDEFSHIPPLLEIEVRETNLIQKYVNLLGYTMENCCNFNVFELIEFYKNKLS